MHDVGYTFNGDSNLGGLTKREADALVLGKLIHDDSDGGENGPDRKRRENHREKTEQMIADVGSG